MKQCSLLGVSRSSYYYQAVQNNKDTELQLLLEIIKVLQKYPFYGYRKVAVALSKHFEDEDIKITRKKCAADYEKSRFAGYFSRTQNKLFRFYHLLKHNLILE